MRTARCLSLAAISIFTLTVVTGLKVGDPPGEQLQVFADTFLQSLDSDQVAKATMEYTDARRVDWHFIPKKSRKGLRLSEMNDAQRTAALRMLRAALSEIGYMKADQIRGLEAVLRELEGEGRTWDRDPMKYFVTIFGKPTDQGPWAFSFEGHHLSLNFVCRDGRIVDSTPQFMAANPATIMNDVSGPLGKGTRVLRSEEQIAFDLVNSLNDEQFSMASIADEAPAEIRFAGDPQPIVGDPEGIAMVDLDANQTQQLKSLIKTYVDIVPDKVAKTRMDRIEAGDWDKIHFAWAGAKKPGIGHYYRVRGDSFLIEFVNTQADAAGNPANHIHCVWRDLTGDFDLPPAE